MITIERYVRFKIENTWAGDVPSAIDQRASLSFTGDLEDLPTWSVALAPQVLYRDAQTNEWVIVASSDRCEAWYARGKPFPPYWEYRLVGQRWVERPLSESSMGLASNLFLDYRRKALPPYITLDAKKAMDEPLHERYHRIVPDIRRHCMVNAK
jgi:hypothetical protein